MSSIVAEQTVSEQYEYVIGVDTHAATHTFALVAAATGGVLAHAEFPTSPAGLSRAHHWLTRRVGARAALVVVEGTGSFGAILTVGLQAAGRHVVEAARMPATDRRGTGKSDDLDATRIARAVLGSPLGTLRVPRELSSERAQVAMRVLVVAREQMTKERTRTINTLTALVRTVDLGVDARRALTPARSPPSPAGVTATRTPRPPPAGAKRCAWPAGSTPSTTTSPGTAPPLVACRCSVSGVELDGWDKSEHRGGHAMARAPSIGSCTPEGCAAPAGVRRAVEPERRAPMSAVVACLGFTRGRRRRRRRTRRAARRRAGLRAVSRPRTLLGCARRGEAGEVGCDVAGAAGVHDDLRVRESAGVLRRDAVEHRLRRCVRGHDRAGLQGQRAHVARHVDDARRRRAQE